MQLLLDARTVNDFRYSLSPLLYAKSLGFDPYEWQTPIIESTHKRKVINGARQSGKSTLISLKPCHRARFFPGSLWIIAASTEKQAVEDMEKIKHFISKDPDFPRITRDSDSLLEFDNASRILVVPATEKAARGYSNPDGITLDEASRIEDGVYRSGIRPMLTDNAKCELILISTPNGREGFFHRAWQSERWERYEIKAPWEPDDKTWTLEPAPPEEEYRKARAQEGIRAYYSKRHGDLEEQQENLDEMGPRWYRQEYGVEFVEHEGQVFLNDDISAMYSEEVTPMEFSHELTEDVQELRSARQYTETR